MAYRYLVAMACGGVMEDPDIHYEDYQVIIADTEREAERIYDQINNCTYYYGQVIRCLGKAPDKDEQIDAEDLTRRLGKNLLNQDTTLDEIKQAYSRQVEDFVRTNKLMSKKYRDVVI